MFDIEKDKYKAIHEDYFKDTVGMTSRDYNRLQNFCRKMPNGDVVYFEICQWRQERSDNTFDYDYIVVRDGEVIYTESNGEMKIGNVVRKLFETFDVSNYDLSEICYEDFLDGRVACVDCGHCEEW